MQTLERIHNAIQAAEEAPDADGSKALLLEARTLLAEAVIAGETLDRDPLQQLAIRAGTRGQRLLAEKDRTGIAWGALLSAISDYLESGGVPMPDGRVATVDGWNTENCPPT